MRLDENLSAGKVRFDAGGVLGVAGIGHGFGNSFRVQVEGDWRYKPLSRYVDTSLTTDLGGWQTVACSGMLGLAGVPRRAGLCRFWRWRCAGLESDRLGDDLAVGEIM